MAIATKVSRWITAGLIASSLVSCNPWTVLSQQDQGQSLSQNRKVVAVSEIANLSSQNLGTDIYIKGKVIQKAPFLDSGAYEIQDGTGRIWVVTQRKLPAMGTEVLIAGQVSFHDLQLQQNNFGELFIQEIQSLDPTQVQQSSVTSQNPVTPPEKPKKPSLDFQFLPHKEYKKP